MSSEEIITNILDGIIKTASKFGTTLVLNQLNNVIDYLIPDLTELSNEELAKKGKIILKVLDSIESDEEGKELIKTAGDKFSKLTIELIDAIEPSIIELTDRVFKLMKDLIGISIKTGVKTVVGIIMSVIGEVPVVGGVIDLAGAGIFALDGVANNIRMTTSHISEMTKIAQKLTGVSLSEIGSGIDAFDDIRLRFTAVKEKYNRQIQKITNVTDGLLPTDNRMKQKLEPAVATEAEAEAAPPPYTSTVADPTESVAAPPEKAPPAEKAEAPPATEPEKAEPTAEKAEASPAPSPPPEPTAEKAEASPAPPAPPPEPTASVATPATAPPSPEPAASVPSAPPASAPSAPPASAPVTSQRNNSNNSATTETTQQQKQEQNNNYKGSRNSATTETVAAKAPPPSTTTTKAAPPSHQSTTNKSSTPATTSGKNSKKPVVTHL